MLKSADPLDQAAEREETERQSAIKAVRERGNQLKPNGQCYNCREPLVDRVFCDADCSHDHERLRMNRIR